jgi:sugar (pentulose or hexulose) kinase
LQVRALILGQLLSMRAHAERFGMPSPRQRITATGGASANQSILNSRASIFGGDVRTKTWSPAVASTSFSYSGFSELDSSPDGCENLILSWQALHP